MKRNTEEKVRVDVVIYVNDRLTAVNIANYAFKLGLIGDLRRESEICDENPGNMYKIRMWGRVPAESKKAFYVYVENAPNICDFKKNHEDK